MSSVLDSVTVLTSISVGGITVLGAVGWVLRRGSRFGKRVGFFLDDYFGEQARDGVPARLGVMTRLLNVEVSVGEFNKRLARMEEMVKVVHHELTPNGGNSVNDKVTRIDEATTPNQGRDDG